MGRVFGATILIASLWGAPVVGADIAVDVTSGEVLTATDADAPRLPASLTKLMTAYVAFEAMAMGEIKPDQRVEVSRFAAQRPPVKLGLSPGTTVPFLDILSAAVVGSKNDAATVVAEAVAGNEAAFVARMNDAARALGMTNTTFANSTGLPAPGQKTTARDIALLSRALLLTYPKRSDLFSRRSVTALGKRVGTTNPLFGRVKGAEGLKTGFTCAAGYAIAGLVERDGRRIIAVTLGHQNKSKRLNAVKGLIEAAFQLSGSGELLESGPAGSLPPSDVGACGAATAKVVATDIPPEEMALYAAELAKAKRRVAVKKWQSSPPQQVQTKPESQSSLSRNGQTNAGGTVAALPPPVSGWGVFLGAHANEQVARSAIRALRLRIGTHGVGRTERRVRDGRFLALLHGLNRREASTFCRVSDRYCVVLPPALLLNPRAQWRR